MTLPFRAFPSIESFHNIVKSATKFLDVQPPLEWPYQGYSGGLTRGAVNYRGKIKLHGTNAAIRVGGGEFAAQSRSQIITTQHDNVGFAHWVESLSDYWKGLGHYNGLADAEMTIFGEWCGKGIMKGTAIQQIPNKIFAVFAILDKDFNLISEPKLIEALLPNRPADIHILPWYGEAFVVDYNDRNRLQEVADKLNAVVAEVEPVDPWVKQVFGVEGTAEGVVYYPGAGETLSVKAFDYAFKAKGEKHKVVKTKESVQVDPEVAASIEDFVKMFATEARLEQGFAAIGGSTEMKNIGPFLKWMGTDISKESADELEASDLTWEAVQKHVQLFAKNWFIAKGRNLQ